MTVSEWQEPKAFLTLRHPFAGVLLGAVGESEKSGSKSMCFFVTALEKADDKLGSKGGWRRGHREQRPLYSTQL